jgi:hypothetical protein
MWIKYTHTFASGEVTWEWADIGSDTSKEAVEDFLTELQREYDWSEHYRGVDYEIIELPPREILQKRIDSAMKMIQNLQLRVSRYTEDLARAT